MPIATEHYPPYEMVESIAGLKGFDYEVLVEIFKRLDYEIDVEFLPWKRALAYTKRGKVLGILTCAYEKDREKYMIFSNPISTRSDGYYIRANFEGPKPTVIEDVMGQKVASVSAYTSLQILKKAHLNPMAANNTEAAIGMLLKKRFDYLYVNKQSTDFIIQQLSLASAFNFYPITHNDFYFCFSKKYKGVTKIVHQFNQTLKSVKEDGTYNRIHDKYR